MIDSQWSSSEFLVFPGWVGSILFALLLSVGILLIPRAHKKLRRLFFPIIIFPALIISTIFILRGLEPLDRPVVHWIFQKQVFDNLGIGFVFDTLTLLVVLVFSVVLLTVCFRNKPRVEVISALSLSWVGLVIVASSKTFWTAALGLGIALIAKILPILSSDIKWATSSETLDSLWMAASKRASIGAIIALAGAAGLASSGIQLNFFMPVQWSGVTESPKATIAASLLFIGLFLHFLPLATSSIYHQKKVGHLEEENFIFETVGGWISLLIFYRLMPNIRDTYWAVGIVISALVLLGFSLLALSFIETRRSAISFWLSSIPLMILTVLPSLHAGAAFLFIAGSMITFCGLFLCLDHDRSPADISIATFFFLGLFGFFGWSNALPVVTFFSGFEDSPIFVGAVFLLWLVFGTFGFRILIRGGDSESGKSPLIKWISSGFFILLGFGPLLSGRWGGGILPDVIDWLDGAKDWPWIKTISNEIAAVNWIGFALSHAMVVVAVLLGTFIFSTLSLFPFADRYPRGLAAARGMFGWTWLHNFVIRYLKEAGLFLNDKVSTVIWDHYVPKMFEFGISRLRWFGEVSEVKTDFLTSSQFSCLFSAPSKLVQWFHGGNIRLYAWFALGWILIISIYLIQ